MLPAFEAPAWVMKVLISALLIGVPIALGFSWAFEITPEGIKRESEIAPDKSIAQHTGRKIVGLTIVVAVLAAGLFSFQILRPKSKQVEGGAPATPEDASPARTGLAETRPSTVAAPPVPDKSIAVLPFDNLSDDKSNAYFAEGIQDEILTRLARVADLKVISRTSTQHFKSAPENLRDIAKQLGVMNVLEGSVQRSNDQVRVNVQLINALTDAHLWADMYDRKMTDLFTVESDIAKTIADTLQAKLSGSEQRAIAAYPTENTEAYQLYLQGRFFWNKRTSPDLRKANPGSTRRRQRILITRWPTRRWRRAGSSPPTTAIAVRLFPWRPKGPQKKRLSSMIPAWTRTPPWGISKRLIILIFPQVFAQ